MEQQDDELIRDVVESFRSGMPTISKMYKLPYFSARALAEDIVLDHKLCKSIEAALGERLVVVDGIPEPLAWPQSMAIEKLCQADPLLRERDPSWQQTYCDEHALERYLNPD